MTGSRSIPPLPPVFLDKINMWPDLAAQRFCEVRYLILDAARAADAGKIAESLKWSEPAWRPARARQGSTLRASWSPKFADTLGLFVDCKTTLAQTMQDLYPLDFQYEANRTLRLDLKAPLPDQAIDHLARMTFFYHRKTSR